MQNPSEKDVQNLIESAMSRLPAKSAGETSAAARERNSIGRRDYDQLLTQRLEQLRNAIGDQDQPAPPQTPSPSPALANPLPAISARDFGTATLAATAIASALAGAGLSWLLLSKHHPTPFLPPATVASIPAVLPAPISAPALPPAAPAQAEAAVAPQPPEEKPAEEAARELLEGWRTAWSNRDVDAYLGYYSPDFASDKGLERSKWAETRRKNLSGRSQISVSVHQLNIERLADNQMQLNFLQDYSSGNYRETAQPKTLLLQRQTNNWLIVGEWQGGNPPPAASK